MVIPDIALEPDMSGVWRVEGTFEIELENENIDNTKMNSRKSYPLA
jgi:hypothetical protein